MKQTLVHAQIVLERFPGKGGWTYAAIPAELRNQKKPFGWAKVTGSIDDYQLPETSLMPMGNGNWFLPVKAAIRKVIGKEAGDTVTVVLYAPENKFGVADEFMECLRDEPAAYAAYLAFPEAEQEAYLKWINEPTDDEARISRMATAINRISEGKPCKQP